MKFSGAMATEFHPRHAHLIHGVGAAVGQERARARVAEHVILRQPAGHLRQVRKYPSYLSFRIIYPTHTTLEHTTR